VQRALLSSSLHASQAYDEEALKAPFGNSGDRGPMKHPLER